MASISSGMTTMRRSATPSACISAIKKVAFLSSDLPVRISLPMTTTAAVFCRIREILIENCKPCIYQIQFKLFKFPRGRESGRSKRMPITTSLIACALTLCTITTSLVPGQSKGSSNASMRAAMVAGNGDSTDWPMYGRDLAGSHYNPNEKQLTPATVARLKPKWVFQTGADVSSQPTVVDGVVYFGSWDGKQYAVDAKTGKKIWEFDLGMPSRSGAAYADGIIYFGDAAGRLFALN